MIGILVRREKESNLRKRLLDEGVEFYEEKDRFHTLFLFPSGLPADPSEGKKVYFVDDSIQEIELSGKTFAIRGSRESIERFAPLLEAKGMLVDLENPDLTLEIRKWGKKFLISVF